MNSVEISLIQKKAENIQRLRELEQDRNKEILGRRVVSNSLANVLPDFLPRYSHACLSYIVIYLLKDCTF